jgi:hypothetical protein
MMQNVRDAKDAQYQAEILAEHPDLPVFNRFDELRNCCILRKQRALVRIWREIAATKSGEDEKVAELQSQAEPILHEYCMPRNLQPDRLLINNL